MGAVLQQFRRMGAALRKFRRNTAVAPDTVDEVSHSSDNNEVALPRQRDEIRCFHCAVLLNDFNRCSGSTCIHCLKMNSSAVDVLAHAGPVAHALEQSYRVRGLVSGLDELRDLYFHSKIVQPHLDREKKLEEMERMEDE